jgi:hypothetical protein
MHTIFWMFKSKIRHSDCLFCESFAYLNLNQFLNFHKSIVAESVEFRCVWGKRKAGGFVEKGTSAFSIAKRASIIIHKAFRRIGDLIAIRSD